MSIPVLSGHRWQSTRRGVARRGQRSGAWGWAVLRLCVPLGLLLCASSGSPLRAAQASPYILSGSPDGSATFDADDNLDVYLNGTLIYTENVPQGTPRTHQPIVFTASAGDTLRFVVRDTYGICAMLSTVFLTDATGNSTVADPGFDLGCGRPEADLGVVHDFTFVIPDFSVTPVAEAVEDIRTGSASSNPGTWPSSRTPCTSRPTMGSPAASSGVSMPRAC